MRVIPYILYLYLLAFHYTILSGVVAVWGVTVDLTALMVILVGLYKSETTALWFAVGAAVVSGTLRLDLMPWELFLLGSTALVVSRVSIKMNLESITSRLIILGGFLFIHQLAITLLTSPDDIVFMLYRSIVPCTLYSLIIGWFYFQFKDGRITWQKVKSLF